MDLDITSYLILFFIAGAVFLLLDLVWLGLVAKDFYRKQLGKLLPDKFNARWAGVFYVTYLVGVLYFAVVPALNQAEPLMALIDGFLFGFFAYATYDFTNAATLKNWPTKVVWVDLLWGSVLTMTVSGLTYGLYSGLVG